jgi:hypothetical protein
LVSTLAVDGIAKRILDFSRKRAETNLLPPKNKEIPTEELSCKMLTSASPLLDKNTFTTLKVLERILSPAAAPEDRLLGEVIRTMARYIRVVPAATADEDLALLLAVSVALAESRQ